MPASGRASWRENDRPKLRRVTESPHASAHEHRSRSFDHLVGARQERLRLWPLSDGDRVHTLDFVDTYCGTLQALHEAITQRSPRFSSTPASNVGAFTGA
jgi:hypothetical protein